MIAVAKTPRKPGDRVKTDRRDALALARYLRSGELTPVTVPDPRDEPLREQVEDWRFAPVVRALMTLKGIDFIAAVTLVAELGDLARFAHSKELMSYLGLVPSEYSTGESRIQGAITKAGNSHVRRLLVESAWSYRYPPLMSRERVVRSQAQPKIIRDRAWKVQLRLCSRYKKLTARGVHQNKVCIAIARELAAFVWDVARHVPVER